MPNAVGGEVDAYCTKCKMVLAHIIVAMVGDRVARVHCNTCNGEHVYKAGPPGTSKPKRTARAGGRASSTRSRAEVVSFDDKLAGKDTSQAKPYAIAQRFAAGDLVAHPTFGLGIVETVRPDKVDVTFREFVKTLVHGRSGPARPPPTNTRTSPARYLPESDEDAQDTTPAAESEVQPASS